METSTFLNKVSIYTTNISELPEDLTNPLLEHLEKIKLNKQKYVRKPYISIIRCIGVITNMLSFLYLLAILDIHRFAPSLMIIIAIPYMISSKLLFSEDNFDVILAAFFYPISIPSILLFLIFLIAILSLLTSTKSGWK